MGTAAASTATALGSISAIEEKVGDSFQGLSRFEGRYANATSSAVEVGRLGVIPVAEGVLCIREGDGNWGQEE